MHENYLYDLWPPWLDLTLHLHEMPAPCPEGGAGLLVLARTASRILA